MPSAESEMKSGSCAPSKELGRNVNKEGLTDAIVKKKKEPRL